MKESFEFIDINKADKKTTKDITNQMNNALNKELNKQNPNSETIAEIGNKLTQWEIRGERK